MNRLWQPEIDFSDLESHLEDAFKRALGIAGFRIGQDKLNLSVLTGTADNVLDFMTGAGPRSLRIGQSLIEAVSYRPKNVLSLKNLAAEILDEFYREGQTAFQATRLKLSAQADQHLTAFGLGETRLQEVLAAAGETFLPPSRSEMTQLAWPYVQSSLGSGSLALAGGVIGAAAMALTLRHPVSLVIGAGGGGALAHYLGRRRIQKKGLTLLDKLPEGLRQLMRRTLASNVSNYKDTINLALKD